MEGPAVEQHRDHRLSEQHQRRRAGQREQNDHAQAPVEERRVGGQVVASLCGRELRRQHDAQRDAEQGGGELHQAVGIVQPGHSPDRDIGSDLQVDQQRELRHRHAEQRRRHLPQHAVHAVVPPRLHEARWREGQARHHADGAQRRNLHHELQHAADHHPGSQRIDRLDTPGAELRHQQPGRGDHRHVEQHRRGRRHRETPPGVQRAGRQGHQRHEADVGEHPARHAHCGGAALVRQAGREQPHQRRRTENADDAGQHQRPQQHRGHCVDEAVRRLVAVARPRGRQQRHEGLRERALGEEAAQQVGNAEGDPEGVGQRIGAEEPRHQLLAHQAGDARSEREQGNSRGGPEETHR